MALGAYNKQYEQRCHKCGMVTNLVIVSVWRTKKTEKNDYKKKNFDGVCHHWGRKCTWVKIVIWEKRKQKKNEEAKKAVDGNGDELVFCSLMMENKKVKEKKKAVFVEGVKMPTEAGILCSIDGDTFFSFTKNTWIGEQYWSIWHYWDQQVSTVKLL